MFTKKGMTNDQWPCYEIFGPMSSEEVKHNPESLFIDNDILFIYPPPTYLMTYHYF